eukprot:2043198-Rhodomonas_salina.1
MMSLSRTFKFVSLGTEEFLRIPWLFSSLVPYASGPPGKRTGIAGEHPIVSEIRGISPGLGVRYRDNVELAMTLRQKSIVGAPYLSPPWYISSKKWSFLSTRGRNS